MKPGESVLLVDDLLATGGTAAAAVKLLDELGANLVGISFLIELGFLDGRAKLGDHPIQSILTLRLTAATSIMTRPSRSIPASLVPPSLLTVSSSSRHVLATYTNRSSATRNSASPSISP